MRVVVTGAGIAGLSVAWALRQRQPDADIIVLERASRTGGNIRTEQIDGYLCESGPQGFLDNEPATLQLVRELGLQSRLQPSSDAARHRYIFRNGELHEVPMSAPALMKSRLLSIKGKARRAVCPPPPGG